MIHPRIISLLPSATEIVAALGFVQHLVGRSHECDFPPGVEKLAVCSSSKVPARGSSFEIDERVKAIVAEGLSVYRVDVERLRELQPNLILTQTQCAVCAVTPRDLEEALCTWVATEPAILSLEPNNLDDVWNDIRRVGDALGVSQRANELIASLTQRLAEIRENIQQLNPAACRGDRVARSAHGWWKLDARADRDCWWPQPVRAERRTFYLARLACARGS